MMQAAGLFLFDTMGATVMKLCTAITSGRCRLANTGNTPKNPARHQLALRLGNAVHRWPRGGLQGERSMYRASKRYVAASVSALVFGTLFSLGAIVARRIAAPGYVI
jgi:hypothetical protein